ncbi:hypothetical protein UY3_16073 [Chelonia mydas]|uniref:Uncharacterized protein n=1 Tax=Chelonia mydas TaxID=8469 RepID=M7ANN6_CHEMY|nr:hypothetical protein UY3_16073 [Chelonia mydas]
MNLSRLEVASTEKLAHTELVQMNRTYWCVTAQNHSIELNGKPCPLRHPSVCMTVPQRATLTSDRTWLHRTLPMMGNLTWDPEWHYSSKYLEEGLQALQAKIKKLVAEAQRHIGEGRLRYTLIGETGDQADVKYSEVQNQAVEVKAMIMGDAISERGHDQDTLQCRVKVKELRNTYHKAWEANRCSSAVPMSCQFHKKLVAKPGGDPNSTAKATVDTSLAHMPVKSGPSQEEEILDEDVEGEGNQRQRTTRRSEMHATRSSFLPQRRLVSHSCRSLAKRKQERRPLLNGCAQLERGYEELKRTFCVMS